jgi:Malectin domain
MMKNIVLVKYLSSLLLILLQHCVICSDAASGPIRINCGSSTNTVDKFGNTWIPDPDITLNQYGTSLVYSNCSSDPNIDVIVGTDLDAILCSERYYTTPRGGYNIKVDNGVYTVELLFAELYYKAPGQRVFNVSVQDTVIAPNLDVFVKAGYNGALSIKTNVTVTGEFLNIALIASKEYAKINGIYISPINMPPVPARLAPPVRINAGATINWTDPVSKVVWGADRFFTGGNIYGNNTCLNSIDGTQLDALVCSERFFSSSIGISNGKYVIPMRTGTYVLKLLFAEVLFDSGTRVFNVMVQGKQIITKLDIASLVGKNSAFIISRSVTVAPTDAGIVIEFFNVQENAKINAIEVLRPRSGSLERAPSD